MWGGCVVCGEAVLCVGRVCCVWGACVVCGEHVLCLRRVCCMVRVCCVMRYVVSVLCGEGVL